ncbi:MAG: ribonuclease T2 family protein [Rubrimonas sp.]
MAAAQNVAGRFDHYVLALSWSPSWCATDPRADRSEQCAPDGPKGFIVHGLWPQHLRGWPEFCSTHHRGPTRAETRAMADVMGSAGLAWHAWRKHGRCSGLSAADYFALTRRAYATFRHPTLPRSGGAEATLSRQSLEELIRAANPDIPERGMVLRCDGNLFRELRLCLSKQLAARSCTSDAQNNCKLSNLTFPVR